MRLNRRCGCVVWLENAQREGVVCFTHPGLTCDVPLEPDYYKYVWPAKNEGGPSDADKYPLCYACGSRVGTFITDVKADKPANLPLCERCAAAGRLEVPAKTYKLKKGTFDSVFDSQRAGKRTFFGPVFRPGANKPLPTNSHGHKGMQTGFLIYYAFSHLPQGLVTSSLENGDQGVRHVRSGSGERVSEGGKKTGLAQWRRREALARVRRGVVAEECRF